MNLTFKMWNPMQTYTNIYIYIYIYIYGVSGGARITTKPRQKKL